MIKVVVHLEFKKLPEVELLPELGGVTDRTHQAGEEKRWCNKTKGYRTCNINENVIIHFTRGSFSRLSSHQLR